MATCKCFWGASPVNLIYFFIYTFVLATNILYFVFYGRVLTTIKSLREEDRFVDTESVINFYQALLLLGVLILVFNAITSIKMLIQMLPNRFGTIKHAINFLNFTTFYLVLWNMAMLLIPTVMAYLLLNTQVYGFSSLIFVFSRVFLFSQGGWLFNRTAHLGIKENLAMLPSTTPIS